MSRYLIAAHPIQQAILDVADGKGIADLSLREIGKRVGLGPDTSPQKIKHHLTQMVRYGFLDIVDGKYQVARKLRRTA